jgi:hypothetical protein
MSGQWSKHDFISIQKSVSSLWLGDCSNFRTLSKNLCCQAQIALLLTVRRSWCQCQIWQKRRCATTTSAGDLGNGNTKGPNYWRLWNQVDHGLSWDLSGCGSSVSARSNSGQLFDWKIDWKLCQEMQRSHVQVRAWLWGASFCLDLSHVASGGWSPSSDGAGVQGSTMASLWLHYWLDFWGVAM